MPADGFLHRYFLNNAHKRLHKWVHYFDIYERHFERFRNRPIIMLEIGVSGGGSLAMWREYLGTDARIVGLDVNPACKAHEGPGIEIFIGSQDDEAVLDRILEKYPHIDIVLDDGSHRMRHLAATFQYLYPRISPHGVYMVEDLHTCYWDEYGGGLKRAGSFMELAKDMIDSLNAVHSRGAVPVTDFTASTTGIAFYDSIVAFERGPQGRRQARVTGPMQAPAEHHTSTAADMAVAPSSSVTSGAKQTSMVPETVRLWREGTIADRQHLAPRLRGRNYYQLIEAAHRELAPRRYFEIGARAGESLRHAQCRSVAVDPHFMLPEGFASARPLLRLFETTSDDFFAKHDLAAELGGQVDLAFLDGMHRFEFLLRDFINTERYCGPDSIIMLHDCVPVSSELVYREVREPRRAEFDVMPAAWAGDVWKLIPILREFRPELKLTIFDAMPTGLVFVTGLDASSQTLREAFDGIVVRYMDRDLAKIGVSEFVKGIGLRPTAQGMAPGRLTEMIRPGVR